MARESTARERREARETLAGTYFHKELLPKLSRVVSSEVARAIAEEALPGDHVGRPYHARLLEFLASREVPRASSLAERLMYMALARRFAGSGEIETSELIALEERFKRAAPPAR